MGFGRGVGFSPPPGGAPGTLTAYADGESGHLQGIGATWDLAHDLGNGLPYEHVDPDYLDVRKRTGTDDYSIQRGISRFDTSGLPDTCTIAWAKLYICFYQVLWIRGVHSVVVVDGSACGDNIAVGDYGTLKAATAPLAAYLDVGALALGAWTWIQLNSAGLAIISKTGKTKIGLRLDLDVDDIPATDAWECLVSYRGSLHATLKSYLVVNYS